MHINKENYQEFLLLYVDNELSAKEVTLVEQFVANNDFAKAELDILMGSKLNNETISFGSIEHLLKQSSNEISIDNCEEKFLLYVDNELTDNDKKQVEVFVLKHPQKQIDFVSINKTKLEAIAIPHPNKEELLKTKKSFRVYISRLAVAAVFIGIIAMAWVFSNNNKAEVVAKNNDEIKDRNSIKKEINNKIVAKENTTITKDLVENNNTFKETILTEDKKQNASAIESKEEIIIAKIDNKNVTENTIKTNVQEQTKNNNLPSNNVTKDYPKNNTTESLVENNKNSIDAKTEINTSNKFTNNQSINNTTTSAVAVVYKNLEDDDDDNTSTKKQRSKIKSLLHKASKIVNVETEENNKPKKLFSLTL